MYSDEKTAQIAGYLLMKAGGRLPNLKLIKLMYLADREALRLCSRPISHDRFVSMKHGPVLSRTLDLIHDDVESEPWSRWIEAVAAHELKLRDAEVERDSFDELADADLAVLDQVWAAFGHLDKWAIRDYTHAHCPEWRDPGDSSAPISLVAIFLALGFSREEASVRARDLREQEHIQRQLVAVS